MGDGAAEGSLLGSFRIDVDELMVFCAIGELVDALLIDGEPLGVAQILAYVILEGASGNEWHIFSKSSNSAIFL
ncbi:hypothetical protein D3C80_1273050 [compost metagenome]